MCVYMYGYKVYKYRCTLLRLIPHPILTHGSKMLNMRAGYLLTKLDGAASEIRSNPVENLKSESSPASF